MRGGKRSGSGRPKGDGSKVVRVPLGCLSDVEAVIAAFRNNDSFFLEKHRECCRSKAVEVRKEKIKKIKNNKFYLYEKKYESLPRAYRRSLMKKYKNIESIVKHLIETNE